MSERTDTITPTHVRCTCCKGTGHIELTGCYLETLVALRQLDAPVSGADLARRMGTKNEAMCNRLRGLERKGLVEARKCGRKVLWRAVA